MKINVKPDEKTWHLLQNCCVISLFPSNILQNFVSLTKKKKVNIEGDGAATWTEEGRVGLHWAPSLATFLLLFD